jgi:hypothetical protein
MTEQRELRIPFNDLLNMVLSCKCGTEVTIDFTKEGPQKANWKMKALQCPICMREFDSNLRLGFDDFMQWYDRVKASKESLSFRIRPSN